MIVTIQTNPDEFAIKLPQCFIPELAVLDNSEINILWTSPDEVKSAIIIGIDQLDRSDIDSLLPAYYAYRMGKIPGNQVLPILEIVQ